METILATLIIVGFSSLVVWFIKLDNAHKTNELSLQQEIRYLKEEKLNLEQEIKYIKEENSKIRNKN